MKNTEERVCGSLYYMAPELIKSNTISLKTSEINPGIDIWSMGCILYALVYGKLPFKANSRKEQLELINKGIKFPVREVAPDLI